MDNLSVHIHIQAGYNELSVMPIEWIISRVNYCANKLLADKLKYLSSQVYTPGIAKMLGDDRVLAKLVTSALLSSIISIHSNKLLLRQFQISEKRRYSSYTENAIIICY